MKRKIARTLLIVLVAVFFVSMAATLQAKGKDPQCTLALTAGTYGFSDTGTVVGVGPRAAVGIFTLDAAGNVLNGKATASLNGSVAAETFSGTYTVNPDCTGSAAIDIFDQSGNKILSVTTGLVFDDNVRELRQIFTSVELANGTPLHIVITVNARKLFPGPGGQNEQ